MISRYLFVTKITMMAQKKHKKIWKLLGFHSSSRHFMNNQFVIWVESKDPNLFWVSLNLEMYWTEINTGNNTAHQPINCENATDIYLLSLTVCLHTIWLFVTKFQSDSATVHHENIAEMIKIVISIKCMIKYPLIMTTNLFPLRNTKFSRFSLSSAILQEPLTTSDKSNYVFRYQVVNIHDNIFYSFRIVTDLIINYNCTDKVVYMS